VRLGALFHQRVSREAEEGRVSPMMLSILAKVSVAESVYRALRARYSLRGLYLVPILFGEANLLAQFRHMGTFLRMFLFQVNMTQFLQYNLPHRKQRLRW
jgi:hypothetical protein